MRIVPHPPELSVVRHLANRGRSHAPPLPLEGPPRSPQRLEVFGVGPDWIQLSWAALGPGPVQCRIGDHTVELVADGGPGAVVVDGLERATRYRVELSGPGVVDGPLRLDATTLRPPPGEELYRVATLNDVHIGLDHTGFLRTIVEIPTPAELHPVRCLRAALAEALAWGAQQLLVKGDLTDSSKDDHWRQVGDLLADVPVPIEFVPGNHETSRRATIEPQVGLADHGFRLVRGVQVVDRPGIRIVLADTTVPGSDSGRVSTIGDRIISLAGRAPGGVLVGIHHQPMRFRVPTYLPPGIPGPEWRAFVRRLAAANPRVLVSTGHTHRHRRHAYGPIVVTEIGSTKDYPGTWAGYHVHEAGIVQTVRRIQEPSCIRWTEYTRKIAFGVWGAWSPGTLDSRCFSHTW